MPCIKKKFNLILFSHSKKKLMIEKKLQAHNIDRVIYFEELNDRICFKDVRTCVPSTK